MNKDIKIFGIDISKDTFDVMDGDGNHYQFSNNLEHFLKFLKLLDNRSHCVMEATGYYHYQLAYFLLEQTIRVSVENPLSIKRFIQMRLSKIKTDKSDAKGGDETLERILFQPIRMLSNVESFRYLYQAEHRFEKQDTNQRCFTQSK